MKILQKDTLTDQQTNEKILLSCVKRLGRPISILLLNSSAKVFHVDGIDGCIGYYLNSQCAIVIGDPICTPQNSPRLTRAFHAYCEEQKWTLVYFLASDLFAKWAIDNLCTHLLQIGSELTINPLKFEKKQKLRWKVNQSQKHGVIIKEYLFNDTSIENQIKITMEKWLKQKRGFQIYLGTLDLFNNYPEKRVFYACKQDEIVGVIVILRLNSMHGWAMTSFLALNDKTAGISESLMSHVCDKLALEKCGFLCLGFIGGTRIEKVVGLNAISRFFAQVFFKISKWLFRLEEKSVYLSKYHPSLSPTYILCNKKLGLEELVAIKKTLKVKICL